MGYISTGPLGLTAFDGLSPIISYLYQAGKYTLVLNKRSLAFHFVACEYIVCLRFDGCFSGFNPDLRV